MSANLVVDIGGTCQFLPSLPGALTLGPPLSPSGQMCGLSGVVVGKTADLLHSDTFCNIFLQGQSVFASGPLIIGVQTSDTDVSGNFTDPTSGLAQFPTYFLSGGNLILNSGSTGGLLAANVSGQAIQSGFTQFAAFQRLGRYARLIFNSGFYLGPLQAGFVSQLRTTGSGGGFTFAPGSGTVNV